MGVLRKMRGLCRDERGLSTVEYVVLLVLIVGMSVAVWNKFGNRVHGKLQNSSDHFNTQVTRTPN